MVANPRSTTPSRIAGPNVWSGAELPAHPDWMTSFTASELDELMSVLHEVRKLDTPLERLKRTDFPLPRLQQRFLGVGRQLEAGMGFALLRGLPLQGLSDEECKLLFWGIGLQLGVPVSQSRLQNYIAEVKDVGEKMGQATTRAYRAGGPLRFHTDQCDVLALMCVREPVSGGHSRVVSAAAIHNAILERRPDLLPALYEPFSFSRQGEEVAGELPWYERPVFDWQDGHFTSLYSRSYIESAQKIAGVAPLTERRQKALELVSELADELATTIELRQGDLQFFNNHVVYHARTDYVDHADPAQRRTQLRLWLAVPGSRPLPESMQAVFGSSRPGVLRGGVTPPSGRRFPFADWHDAGWTDEQLAACRHVRAA